MVMVSLSAFLPVWSERSISLSVLKWELGDILGVGYILDTVISGFQVHLKTGEGSICSFQVVTEYGLETCGLKKLCLTSLLDCSTFGVHEKCIR